MPEVRTEPSSTPSASAPAATAIFCTPPSRRVTYGSSSSGVGVRQLHEQRIGG